MSERPAPALSRWRRALWLALWMLCAAIEWASQKGKEHCAAKVLG